MERRYSQEPAYPSQFLFENLAGGLTLDEILDSWPSVKREQAIEVLRQAHLLIEDKATECAS